MSIGLELGLGLHSRATCYIVGVNVQRDISLGWCYSRGIVIAFSIRDRHGL